MFLIADQLKELLIQERKNISTLSTSEGIVFWTAALTPLWWLLGIQTLFYPTVLVVLLLLNIDIDSLVRHPLPIFIYAWVLMVLAACMTTLIGLEETQASLKTVAASLVTLYKGYFLIFCSLTVPFLTRIRPRVVVRAAVWLSIGMLFILLIQMVLLGVGVNDRVFVPPLARAIPGDVSASLLVRSAKTANFFGIPLPRSILHTADPPILGLVGLLCFVMCLEEENRRLQTLALTGAVSALIISFSRSAWLGFILSLMLISIFRLDLVRQAFVQLAAATFWVCSLLSITVTTLLESPVELFKQARVESSSTRNIVIQETIEAWQEKIWLGWGIIRGEAWLYDDVYIKLGSFSTYAAILYLHGLVGFIIFVISISLTLFALLRYAVKGNASCQKGFASFLVLCLLIQATPLTWMAIYLWLFFVWISSIIAEAVREEEGLVAA